MWNWNCPHGFITGGNSNCCCWLPHFYINNIICTMGPFELCMILEKSAYSKDASNITICQHKSYKYWNQNGSSSWKCCILESCWFLKTNKRIHPFKQLSTSVQVFHVFLCDGKKVFKSLGHNSSNYFSNWHIIYPMIIIFQAFWWEQHCQFEDKKLLWSILKMFLTIWT